MVLVLADGWNYKDSYTRNHESSLSGDELLHLAGTIIDLKGLKDGGDGVGDFWKVLGKELQSSNTVWITKGIHEIESRPHFNIQMTKPYYKQTIEVFVFKSNNGEDHVSGGAIAKKVAGQTVTRTLYPYRVSGMSIIYQSVFYTFPAQYMLGTRKADRRKSLSIGNSTRAASADEIKAALAGKG